jgi:hypothetical protein
MNLHHPKWLLLGLAIVATTAVAASAHFVRGPNASLGSPELNLSWKEAGLGDTVSVDYLATATAAARYQCVNRGGKCPAASNKEEVFDQVSAPGTFSSGKNGSITGQLTIQPPVGPLVCPGNQVKVLTAVSYTNIALADLTNGVSAGASPSALAMSGPECP